MLSLFCSGHQSLRVREHKLFGPYVEGLTKLVVNSFEVRVGELMSYVEMFEKKNSDFESGVYPSKYSASAENIICIYLQLLSFHYTL